MNIAVELPENPSRLKRLKTATEVVHDKLDRKIMEGRPFESRGRYALFLRVQHAFHAQVDGAYKDPTLNVLIPGLAHRARFAEVERDLSDLGIAPDAVPDPQKLDLPEAVGWLYVAEGSNLGAAFLFKEAAKLGLSAEFGARHLAPHPEGRGLNWRRFMTDVDAISLSPEEDARADEGAQAAFRYVHGLVDRIFG